MWLRCEFSPYFLEVFKTNVLRDTLTRLNVFLTLESHLLERHTKHVLVQLVIIVVDRLRNKWSPFEEWWTSHCYRVLKGLRCGRLADQQGWQGLMLIGVRDQIPHLYGSNCRV